jgi:uncharacterized protein YfkK (UPF0435 family)
MNKFSFFLLIIFSLKAFFIFFASQVSSHELSPNIINLQIDKKRISIELTINLEAYLAGVDFSILDNTNDHDNETYYKTLRKLNNSELTKIFLKNWDKFVSLFSIVSEDGTKLNNFNFSKIDTEDIDNTEVSRLSNIYFFVENQGMKPVTFQASRILGEIIFRQTGVENGVTQFLLSGEKSKVISAKTGKPLDWIDTFLDYIPVGFSHILPKGLDHILFVLGLLFLTPKVYPLLIQISIFTIAHTITLAISSLKIIDISSAIIEPLIAASIIYVAIENFFNSSLTKYRSIIIFFFGLLHGLGFASVLSSFGLPGTNFIWALVGFNVGVEIGQLTIILAFYTIFIYWIKTKNYYRKYISIPGSLIIALFGTFWLLERTLLA